MHHLFDWPMALECPRIKVCGLTREEDGIAALEAGASFLGLIFAESPRRVETIRARKLIEVWKLHNANVRVVGVFVNDPFDRIARMVAELGLFAAQIHGTYTMDEIRSADFRVLKAFSVIGPQDDAVIAEAQEVAPVLIDTYSPGKHGGTGKVFDHVLAIPAIRRGHVFIAGGLNPQNVDEVILHFASEDAVPYALDVSSGLEEAKGIKSAKKIVAFFEGVHRGRSSKPDIMLP